MGGTPCWNSLSVKSPTSEEEGVAEMTCDELTTLGEEVIRSEAEPKKK